MSEVLIILGIVILASYLIGSIPTGYLIVKIKTGQDIRTVGSGSTGATNVKRVLGKKWFFIVMLLDAFKGALPVILANLYAGKCENIGLFPVLAAIAVTANQYFYNLKVENLLPLVLVQFLHLIGRLDY